MNFWNIIKYDMTCFSFEGRATRREYICFKIFRMLVSVLLLGMLAIPVLTLFFVYKDFFHLPFVITAIMFLLLLLVFLLCNFLGTWLLIIDVALSVRRFHDFNCSGWIYLVFVLVILFSIILFANYIKLMLMLTGFFVLLELAIGIFVKGSVGVNDFGEESRLFD